MEPRSPALQAGSLPAERLGGALTLLPPFPELYAERTNPGVRKTESRLCSQQEDLGGSYPVSCALKPQGRKLPPFCSALGHPSSLAPRKAAFLILTEAPRVWEIKGNLELEGVVMVGGGALPCPHSSSHPPPISFLLTIRVTAERRRNRPRGHKPGPGPRQRCRAVPLKPRPWHRWGNQVFTAQLCPTPCDPMNCSPAGTSVHGTLQARILQWAAMPKNE